MNSEQQKPEGGKYRSSLYNNIIRYIKERLYFAF